MRDFHCMVADFPTDFGCGVCVMWTCRKQRLFKGQKSCFTGAMCAPHPRKSHKGSQASNNVTCAASPEKWTVDRLASHISTLRFVRCVCVTHVLCPGSSYESGRSLQLQFAKVHKAAIFRIGDLPGNVRR